MRRLFLDIEVCHDIALVWQTGYDVRVSYKDIVRERAIICVAWKWQGEPVQVAKWDKEQCDKALLTRILPIISQADEVVAHNGQKFDLPWIRGRAMFHNLPPLPVVRLVDTLKWARRYYKLNSNTLDYLGRFLGIGRKTESFTEGHGSWRKVLLDNDRKELAAMADYCANDVSGLLEPVWERLSLTCPAGTHAGVVAHREKWTCPRCASENVKQNKRNVTAKGTPQYQMQCRDCGGFYSISETVKRNYVEHKRKAA